MHDAILFSSEKGAIHFIGIGGIGMSGLAELLTKRGFTVTGSDISQTYITRHLEALGVSIDFEQNGNLIDDQCAYVVYSTAIKADNTEMMKADALGIQTVHRSEMLAELIRYTKNVLVAGTHGKTTTTSLVGTLLEAGHIDPTIINGGVIIRYQSNIRVGQGNWSVVEVDESDGSFLRFPSTAGIITNIDAEHIEHYGSFDNLKKSFRQFVAQLPFYGCVAICTEQETTRELAQNITNRHVIRYGFSDTNDIYATNITYALTETSFDVHLKQADGCETVYKNLNVPALGEHNVLNSMAAIAIADFLGINETQIREGFANFEGVKRRFTRVGEYKGIHIIDDYAHHPVEIAATLKTAQAAVASSDAKVIAVFQPHRYSRLRDLFTEFSHSFGDADIVLVSPVYAAGESPIDGADQTSISNAIQQSTSANVLTFDDEKALQDLITQHASAGDLVICMGAGSITQWANALPDQLALCCA